MILWFPKNKFAITEHISRSIVETINFCLCQLIGSLIILVTFSSTRIIKVTINCFINYTRNIGCNELQFINTKSTLL